MGSKGQEPQTDLQHSLGAALFPELLPDVQGAITIPQLQPARGFYLGWQATDESLTREHFLALRPVAPKDPIHDRQGA